METEKKEKTEKKFGKFNYLGIALLFLGMLIAFWMVTSATQNRRLKKIQQEMSLMISRHKTDSTKLAIASADIAEAKAAAANTPNPCLKNRDTICVLVPPPAKINKVRRVSTGGEIRRKSYNQIAKRQNTSSSYQAASDHSSTSVIEGTSHREIFCINVHDMDGSSFWPQLAIDAGDQIENIVLNNTRDGHNVSVYPTKEIVGLFGVTLDKRVFVRADLLDRFGPTIIKISGSPNGWRAWIVAEKIGSYYVADL